MIVWKNRKKGRKNYGSSKMDDVKFVFFISSSSYMLILMFGIKNSDTKSAAN